MENIFDIKTILKLIQGNIPGQVVIQMTDYCNALCPQCSMNKDIKYERNRLELKYMQRIIDSVAAKGFEAISITGGEPFIFKDDVIKILKYASEKNIKYIRTGTNGFLFAEHEKAGFKDRIKYFAETLTETNVRNFWISLDSYIPEVHEEIRGIKGVIKGIEKVIPIFEEFGLYPSANLGINKLIGGEVVDSNNKENFYNYFYNGFDKFYNFANELGFTIVNCCYPMGASDFDMEEKNVYGAVSGSEIVNFSREEKEMVFDAMYDLIPKHRNKIRIFTPRTALYNLKKELKGDKVTFPCRGGKDFYFIDSVNGDVYPCGYIGSKNLGKIWNFNMKNNNHEECRKCHWECFRDPTELIMPIANILSNPISGSVRLMSDKGYRDNLIEDLKYYSACGYFNGREKPNYDKMAKFS